MTVLRKRVGGQWLVLSGAAQLPIGPGFTIITSLASATGTITATWLAPLTGGSAITGYTMTATPVGGGTPLTAPVGASTFIGTVTGAASSVTYTVTITATNAIGSTTGPASAPITAPGSGVLYGPDGTEWAPNTVADTTSFSITVAPSALNATLANVTTAQANAGYVIGLTAGDLAPTATLLIHTPSAMASATKGVLVRAVTPGTVFATNQVAFQNAANVSLAYIDLNKETVWSISNTNCWLIRCHGIGDANFHTSGGGANCGMVGVVCPDSPLSPNDRINLSPQVISGVVQQSMHNFNIDRSWFAGLPLQPGIIPTPHADTCQVDGLTGTLLRTNSYFGPAGNNGTSFLKADIFNYAMETNPFAAIVDITCALAGCFQDGQGNSSSNSGPDTRINCVFYNDATGLPFRINSPLLNMNGASTAPNVTLTGCTIVGTIAGGGGNAAFPNNTFVAYTGSPYANAPVYVPPPWQWW